MGLFDWWTERQQRQTLTRESVRINEDEALIAEHAPELLGMGFTKGSAYILEQIDSFYASATHDQAAEFAGRLIASNESWAADGLTMPYWGNLVVLRRYQAQLAQGDEDPSNP